jgi:hypothetical protein
MIKQVSDINPVSDINRMFSFADRVNELFAIQIKKSMTE